MDTRFWGPSAWQLLHLVAHSKPPPDVAEPWFNNIKNVLPCKFCRASTAEYMEKEIPLHPRIQHLDRWIYDLHNRVNRKLREQSKTDPAIRDPGPDPSFESVRERYEGYLKKSPKVVAGADFLFTLAYNYPEKPTSDLIETHTQFWDGLRILFPYAHQRAILVKALDKHPIYDALQSRSAYMHWVYRLLDKMCSGRIRSYRGMCQHVGYFKSACSNPTYRGKTCRRKKDGSYHKVRDHARTYRLTHSRLIA